ncbi:MAG: helix-turn-helix domain-containing protein [Ignavibacteriales bacterium]|nr:helix-turn-helix domain-containing protein [Ignavibacteriales bacterium]
MNEYLKKFSEQLKAIREEKKVTIDQINTKTRIDKKFLEAIESGNFSIMPDVYMKAFIKEYSRAIDLDPSEVLEKFELANKGLNFENEPEKIEESSEVNEQINPQKTKDAKKEAKTQKENKKRKKKHTPKKLKQLI